MGRYYLLHHHQAPNPRYVGRLPSKSSVTPMKVDASNNNLGGALRRKNKGRKPRKGLKGRKRKDNEGDDDRRERSCS
jgi:hypothetical protein